MTRDKIVVLRNGRPLETTVEELRTGDVVGFTNGGELTFFGHDALECKRTFVRRGTGGVAETVAYHRDALVGDIYGRAYNILGDFPEIDECQRGQFGYNAIVKALGKTK